MRTGEHVKDTNDTAYWAKDIETMEPGLLRKKQLEQLDATVRSAVKAPFYAKTIKEAAAKGVSSFKDIEKLPFTTKDDLRNNFPYGFLAVDLDQAIRLHSSSGTTGNPTVVFHTRADIDSWTDLLARCMYMAGIRKGDVFQNTMGYGLFTGGIGFHYGSERLGALTIPAGPGNSKRQIWFMQQFKTTVMHILPSYAMRLYTHMREAGIDPKKDLNLKVAFIGAEPHSEEMRREIENLYGIKAYNSYGLSEMCGPGVAFECPHQNGLHVWEDFVYPEIIDPETGKALPEGEEGELVLTALHKEAMPLIRYRTRDLTRIIPGSCPCGRTHRRIDRIKGRSDDMLIINGVNIFPIQIERTIMKVPAAGNNYIIEITEDNYMDRLVIKVEMNGERFSGTLEDLEKIQTKITEELKSELGVSPVVKLVEQSSLPVPEGKAKRVYDLRQKNK